MYILSIEMYGDSCFLRFLFILESKGWSQLQAHLHILAQLRRTQAHVTLYYNRNC